MRRSLPNEIESPVHVNNTFLAPRLAGFSRVFADTRFFLTVLVVIVFLESYIPYWYASSNIANDNIFLGQVAYPSDQAMYFSFINQAAHGHFIFYNKLTYLPNAPVFVNLEFLLAGFIQRLFGLSEDAAYQAWRLIGIGLLAASFYLLATLILPTLKRAKAATAVFLFAGGFGFVFVILRSLHLISSDAAQWGSIDIRYGLLPFQQMLTNPHFSLPHGVLLLAYGFFLLGEKRGRLCYYLTSGALFIILGLMRPYDILPPLVILPAFLLLSSNDADRPATRRWLPWVMILPVLSYNIWLFNINTIFRYWARQGGNVAVMPGPLWHYLAYGVIGVLAIWRLTQIRRNPLGNAERFLVLWFAFLFAFIQVAKYVPLLSWSPQMAISLAAPLVLLGFSARTDAAPRPRLANCWAIIGLVILIAASNASIVWYFANNFKGKHEDARYYATKEEVSAWQWLSEHVREKEVVLALPETSLGIAKYTPASVVAAHYSVSPKFPETVRKIYEIFRGRLDASKKLLLEELNVDYIYIGPRETRLNIEAGRNDYLELVYHNPVVSIYKVDR